MPFALFPALAATRFGGGAQTVGLLYAAPAIGGVIASACSGPLSHIHRQGRAVLIAIAIWGAAIAGFGTTNLLWLGVILLAIAGFQCGERRLRLRDRGGAARPDQPRLRSL